MTVLLDTDILVRHFTGDPPAQAARARMVLRTTQGLFLTDLIVAETVYVLESYYEAPRSEVAAHLRGALGSPRIGVAHPSLLWRALELYEVVRLDFAEAYLVALAEASGVDAIASFDQSLDRVRTIQRLEP